MSWVDLAALTMIMWSGAKGYISGAYQALLHLCGLLVALITAVFLQKALAGYLTAEWGIEGYVVDYLGRNVDMLQKTGFSTQQGLELPTMAGRLMRYLMAESAVIPVATRENALAVFAAMLVHLLALFVFFFFLATLITYLLRIGSGSASRKNCPEWQKLAGLLLGGSQGLLLAIIFCVMLDAISVMTAVFFLQQDLAAAYLSLLVSELLRLLPA